MGRANAPYSYPEAERSNPATAPNQRYPDLEYDVLERRRDFTEQTWPSCGRRPSSTATTDLDRRGGTLLIDRDDSPGGTQSAAECSDHESAAVSATGSPGGGASRLIRPFLIAGHSAARIE